MSSKTGEKLAVGVTALLCDRLEVFYAVRAFSFQSKKKKYKLFLFTMVGLVLDKYTIYYNMSH